MDKQDILCKFLININLISKKSKIDAPTQDKASQPLQSLKNMFTSVQTLNQGEKREKTKIPKQLHIVAFGVFILCLSILRAVCNSITLPAS